MGSGDAGEGRRAPAAGSLAFSRPALATFVAIIVSLGIASCACLLVWHERTHQHRALVWLRNEMLCAARKLAAQSGA